MDALDLPFDVLIDRLCLTEREVISALDVSRQTVRRWRSNDSAPRYARKLLVIVARGYLPPSGDWYGFKIDGDTLYMPNGDKVTTGELLGRQYRLEVMRLLRADVARLNAENERLKARLCSANDSIFTEAGHLKQWRLIDD
jgi:hypothetical protein